MTTIHRLRQKVAAELLGVTDRTLRDWHDAPRNADATYSGPALVAWALGRQTSDDLDLDQQRARLASAQAERVEHENGVRRGELAHREEVVCFWTDCIGNARTKLLQLPSRLRGELPPAPTPAQVFDLARRLVHETLTDLAEYEPPRQ